MRLKHKFALFLIGLVLVWGSINFILTSLFMSQRTNSFIIVLHMEWSSSHVRLVNRLQGGPGIADEVRVIVTETKTGKLFGEVPSYPISPGVYQMDSDLCPTAYYELTSCSISVRISNNGLVETAEIPMTLVTSPLISGDSFD